MRARGIVIGIVALVILAVLAFVLLRPLPGTEEVSPPPYWPTPDWRTSTPEEQGFDSGKLADGLRALQEGNVRIDSLLIIRHGYVVLDAYFHPYENTIPHKLASVTKTFMPTLIGIAADQGKLQLDQPVVSFFPGRVIANRDESKERITVRHLVSNQNGFESGCLANDEPTLDAMRANPDWVQAALDRRMVGEPGTTFCYDSPGMHLLSAILQEATGMTALEFARQNLFEPLGIREVYWQSDPRGYTRGWGDLYLKPRDAARLGYLWLHGGLWEGKQIVSASWVKEAATAHSDGGIDDYGYGWWVAEDGYYAMGRGGQNIKVYPSFDAVVVTTASGCDYDEISPMLVAAFTDPENPLPANPANVARLDTVLTALAPPAAAPSASALPDTARAISGKTYVLEPNPIGVATLRLDSHDTAEATLYLKLDGVDVVWPIGLDGRFRVAPGGQALRGYWADPETFLFEVFEDGMITFRLHFADDRLEVSSAELGTAFAGRMENS